MLRNFLFKIARSPFAGWFIGFTFEHLSNILPLNKINLNNEVVIFEHPVKFWNEHLLIIPKRNIRGFFDININQVENINALSQIFSATRELVVMRNILKDNGNFALLINGGQYQDVPQVHFHLAAGIAKQGEGYISNDYAPLEGEVIIENAYCKIKENLDPRREFDYIVLPNVLNLNSFLELDFEKNKEIIIKTLLTLQEFLQKQKLTSFTIIITESDIANLGKFNLRVLAGKKLRV